MSTQQNNNATSTPTNPEVEALLEQAKTLPLALVLDKHLSKSHDAEAHARIRQHLERGVREDHPVIQGERMLMQERSKLGFEAAIGLLQRIASAGTTVAYLNKDSAQALGAEYGLTNKTIGEWRRQRAHELASQPGGTDMESIARATHYDHAQAKALIQKLLDEGKLAPEGGRYEARQPSSSQEQA